MPRHTNVSHTWDLDHNDPNALANGRIVMALWCCARRLPGAFPEHGFDDLGNLIAPVLEAVRPQVATALRAHAKASSRECTPLDVDIRSNSVGLLHNRHHLTLLGEWLARGLPKHKSMFDKAELVLRKFIVGRRHPLDDNVEILSDLLALPPAEKEFTRLAAAFCYGAIERGHFNFVNTNSRLLKCVEAICGASGTTSMRIFDPNRPLARSGLFQALCSKRGGGDLEDMLQLSVVGERLLSIPFADAAEMSTAVLTPLPPQADEGKLEWPHLAMAHALVREALRQALEQGIPGFNILIHGGPGTGKTEFARRLVAEVGGSGFAVDHVDDHGGEASREERLASLRLSQTFAGQHARAVLVVDEAEDIFQGDHQSPFARLFRQFAESKAWMNNLLESNARPVIWISNEVGHLDPAYLRRFAFCLEFPATPFALRRRIAETRLAGLGCTVETIEAVAARDHIAPAVLTSAANFVKLTAASGISADQAIHAVLDGQANATGRNAPPQRPRRAIRFDLRYLNVAGNATPVRLLDALQADTEAALLFSGPPGTGKTQFAAELANRLGRRLVVRTASDINAKWYGESEANVARMFRDCDPTAELLFLDEAEVLLGSRAEASHRADRAVTAEFLRWLEVFEGIFVCATNHASDFDPALTRRFTFRLDFRPLDRHQREAMYRELAVGGLDTGGEAASAFDSETVKRLARLDLLTPGDFANVGRRVRCLGLGSSRWLEELEAEHRAKSPSSRATIGFS